jgi:5'-deoxynucleotidase YfbR-like HD superfamily hydrolase
MSVHKYIRTVSGTKFYYRRPTTAMIKLDDIVWALSRLPRFLGHTLGEPYTILRHSCLVHDLAPDDCKKEALCHDFSEYVLSDISSPCKAMLPDYCSLEQKVEQVIARKFGLRYPYPAAVKTADLIALATEMKALTTRRDYKDLPFPPAKVTIDMWSPEKTRDEFMRRFKALTK